jgi:hypothetical protein
MQSQINMVQIVLVSAVLMRDHFSEIDLLTSRPHLSQWSSRLMQRPSVKVTMFVTKA